MGNNLEGTVLDKEFLVRALDSISDLGMTIYDANGRILYYNQPSALHDNMNTKDVVGKKPSDVFDHQTSSTYEEVLSTGKAVIDKTIIYTNKSGTINHCIGSSYPIKDDGKLAGALSLIRFTDSSMALVEKILELQTLLSDSSKSLTNGTTYTLDSIQGSSKEIREAVDYARGAARSNANIMIYGETGTGKELFAQGIHNASMRREEPFVAVNCSAIPATLLESMFFGTTKGAFTGAKDMPGLFENAGKGTVLLDEINSMPLELQSKLLRVLQERVITRLGSNKLIPVDCTVISTTNMDPLKCIDDGLLRADLFYRLSVITVTVPPLRERSGDVIELAQAFIDKATKIYGRKPLTMDESIKVALQNHTWPGNVRELQHTIEGMVALTGLDDKVLTSAKLPVHLLDASSIPVHNADLDKISLEGNYEDLKDKLDAIEKAAIEKAYAENGNNLTRTAKAIGYSRSNLQYRMKKLGIQ